MTRRGWTRAGGASLALGIVVAGALVASSRADRHAPAAAAPDAPPDVATVQRGKLADLVSAYGTMTFRARPDGSPYTVVNRARGTFTRLPAPGDTVGCTAPIYRVDEVPVLLLCGTVPAYRDVGPGSVGDDVRQLNANLHETGFDAIAGVTVDPADATFTTGTAAALDALRRARGLPVTGALALDDAVVLPEALRVTAVTGALGGLAEPGTPVLQATSVVPEVQVPLDPAPRGGVAVGDRAAITLPGNLVITGTVARVGSVIQGPDRPDGAPGTATVPVSVVLDVPARAAGFDQVSVRVEITTGGVDDALSVPAAAIIGMAGGGFAVEVVRDDARRDLVPVRLGRFDAAQGRVQIDGAVRAGDHVVVPSL